MHAQQEALGFEAGFALGSLLAGHCPHLARLHFDEAWHLPGKGQPVLRPEGLRGFAEGVLTPDWSSTPDRIVGEHHSGLPLLTELRVPRVTLIAGSASRKITCIINIVWCCI